MMACARLTCTRVGVQLTGDITYNGHTLDEFVVQRTAAYVEQTDLHIAEVRRSRVSSRSEGPANRLVGTAELLFLHI